MDAVRFAKAAITNFRQTASVVPSSRSLAKAMVGPVAAARPRVVLEFGPGTGAMTRELLRRMPPDSLLLAFEVNSEFAGFLRASITDSRLQIVHSGAESAAAELDRRGLARVDAVVSSLSLGMMDQAMVHSIFSRIQPYLGADAKVMQFQYVGRLRVDGSKFARYDAGSMLRHHFATVRSRTVWLNFPPAFVITCTDVLPDTERQGR